MEIKPTYISFEQAKWLKEKGFGIECRSYYRHDGVISFWEFVANANDNLLQKNLYSRPEQSQVVEWLRVNHGIWVYVKRGCKIINNEAFDKFQPIIEFIPQVKFDITNIPVFDLPQEAYSAAFDYIKDNNLI